MYQLVLFVRLAWKSRKTLHKYTPGAYAFTVIPYLAKSNAETWVIPLTANLDPQYETPPRRPRFPEAELAPIILPPRP